MRTLRPIAARWLVLALGLLLAAQFLVRVRLGGPPVLSSTAAADRFSAERAVAVLRRILEDQLPHPVGSEANARVRERLIEQLQELGLEVEVLRHQWGTQPTIELHNVLARLPDTAESGRPLVLATHYDSVPEGPGAADAGACVAALLETARALQQGGPYCRPIYLLFTDGEERGMWGARLFVESHALSRDKPFVMNFEARGTAGPSILFETHRGNLATVRVLGRALPAPSVTGSLFVTIYRLLPNDTDFTIFQHAGWTGLNFAFIDQAHHYHTAQDRVENVSLRSVQHHGDNALALASAIATDPAADLDVSVEDAIFCDLLGWQVVYVPQSWGWLVALVPLVVLTLLLHRLREWRATVAACVRLIVIVLLMLLLAAGTGWLLTRGLIATGVIYQNHVPYVNVIAALYVPISLLLVGAVAGPLVRSTPAVRLWHVLWVLWSLTGLLVAIVAPGFSYVVILPALGAAVVGMLPLSLPMRAVVATVIGSLVLLPLMNLLPIALGARVGSLICPAYTLLWLPLLPLLADAE